MLLKCFLKFEISVRLFSAWPPQWDLEMWAAGWRSSTGALETTACMRRACGPSWCAAMYSISCTAPPDHSKIKKWQFCKFRMPREPEAVITEIPSSVCFVMLAGLINRALHFLSKLRGTVDVSARVSLDHPDSAAPVVLGQCFFQVKTNHKIINQEMKMVPVPCCRTEHRHKQWTHQKSITGAPTTNYWHRRQPNNHVPFLLNVNHHPVLCLLLAVA